MPNPIVIRADGVFSIQNIACQEEARDRMQFEKKPRRRLPPIAGSAAAFGPHECANIARHGFAQCLTSGYPFNRWAFPRLPSQRGFLVREPHGADQH